MSEPDLYAELAEEHGHYCPMSTLGLRLGQETVNRLSGESGWQLRYLARTCAVDGIRLALREQGLLTELTVEQQGQHLLCCRAENGKELSVRLTEEALRLSKDYHQLDDAGKQHQLDLLRTLSAERLIEVVVTIDV